MSITKRVVSVALCICLVRRSLPLLAAAAIGLFCKANKTGLQGTITAGLLLWAQYLHSPLMSVKGPGSTGLPARSLP